MARRRPSPPGSARTADRAATMPTGISRAAVAPVPAAAAANSTAAHSRPRQHRHGRADHRPVSGRRPGCGGTEGASRPGELAVDGGPKTGAGSGPTGRAGRAGRAGRTGGDHAAAARYRRQDGDLVAILKDLLRWSRLPVDPHSRVGHDRGEMLPVAGVGVVEHVRHGAAAYLLPARSGGDAGRRKQKKDGNRARPPSPMTRGRLVGGATASRFHPLRSPGEPYRGPGRRSGGGGWRR